jgi:hypothetical protein
LILLCGLELEHLQIFHLHLKLEDVLIIKLF